IWNVENKRENVSVIPVKSKDRGGRTAITAAAYSSDGKYIAGIGQDGELRIWNVGPRYLNPTHSVEKAHIPGNVNSCVNISLDNNNLITRSMDDTLKLWDIRAFKKPVAVASNLPNTFEECDAIFSPDQQRVVTGVSVRRGAESQGRLVFLNRTNLEIVQEVSVPGSVVRVLWHGRINQVIATTSEGVAHVFYDEKVSLAGAKLCAGKAGKAKAVDDISYVDTDAAQVILNPHALPMYKEDFGRKTKRKISKLRSDPVATRKPDQPLSGPGRGGKVGTSLTQHMLKSIIKDESRMQDPREAILRHAEAAAAQPYWIDPAYKATQPENVMAAAVYENELEEEIAAKKQRPQ
ncbi:hypothetical protein HDU76_007809, partial [Blyttiomyces sp. JEL0837]